MVNANKEKIKQYILEHIARKDADYVSKTVDAFGISKSTVYNYLKELSDSGIISSTDKSFKYELKKKCYSFKYENNGKLAEDKVFDNDIFPIVKDLEENVIRAWRYSFTEMMNNAIEHSEASSIQIYAYVDYLNTTISIIDNGVGIFKNIQNYMLKEKDTELSLSECVSLLFAGKFTTARDGGHSGEGIFFTSHVIDVFVVISDGNYFARNNYRDIADTNLSSSTGTIVIMQLSNRSKKKLSNIFNRFSDVEEGFYRTSIPIAHFFPGGFPVSRSEARRLCELLSSFKEVILDFAGVEEIGQAFTHEIFVVWQARNPQIEIKTENACAQVDKMIKRVKNTK